MWQCLGCALCDDSILCHLKTAYALGCNAMGCFLTQDQLLLAGISCYVGIAKGAKHQHPARLWQYSNIYFAAAATKMCPSV